LPRRSISPHAYDEAVSMTGGGIEQFRQHDRLVSFRRQQRSAWIDFAIAVAKPVEWKADVAANGEAVDRRNIASIQPDLLASDTTGRHVLHFNHRCPRYDDDRHVVAAFRSIGVDGMRHCFQRVRGCPHRGTAPAPGRYDPKAREEPAGDVPPERRPGGAATRRGWGYGRRGDGGATVQHGYV